MLFHVSYTLCCEHFLGNLMSQKFINEYEEHMLLCIQNVLGKRYTQIMSFGSLKIHYEIFHKRNIICVQKRTIF